MDISTQKQALLKLRDEYRDTVSDFRSRESGETLGDETATLSHIPTHDADVATETFERERDVALLAEERGVLAQIDRALAKVEDGTYGICERCGRPISDERLEALPYALLCLDDEVLAEGL